MKRKTTADRLKEVMKEKNLKQVDILNMVKPYCKKYGIKLEKNDLSQYISGKVEPGQKKLTILAEALNVSEVWLMGYDVPIEIETLNNETFSNVMKDYIFGAELNNIFDKISQKLNVPVRDLKYIFLSNENQDERELNYENLLDFFENYYKEKENYLDTFLSNTKFEDIENIVKNDKEKIIISFIDFFDILTYIYFGETTKLEEYCRIYERFLEIEEAIKFAKFPAKTNIVFQNKLSEIQEALGEAKKKKLFLEIKKNYSKTDILKEIERRNIFKITDKNNNIIDDQKLKLEAISSCLKEIFDSANKDLEKMPKEPFKEIKELNENDFM